VEHRGVAPLTFEIRLLGRFAVVRDGEEIPAAAFGGRLPRRLLRRLLVDRGELVPKEMLVGDLWPVRPPADPAANLEVLVSRARRALADPDFVATGAGGYAASGEDRIRVDLEVVRYEAARAQECIAAADPGEARAAALAALAAWGGEPLPEDLYEDWAAQIRSAALRSFLDALESGAAAALTLGDPSSAVALAERAAAREPLREPSAMLLVRALAATGDVAAALATFDAFRQRYANDLGLDPSAQAFELQARVLRGESVDPRRAPGSASIDGSASLRPADVATAFAFSGREAELTILRGDDHVILVRGTSGSGKTRLLAEATTRSTLPVIRARAFLAERLEPWSLARSLLRETLALDAFAGHSLPDVSVAVLREVLPEIAGDARGSTPTIDALSRRGLALEGARRMVEVVAAAPTLLIADDLQWADATSLQFLSILSARVESLRLILAYRPDEVGTASTLGGFLDEIARSVGIRTLSMGPLSADAVAEIVDDPSIAGAIADGTDRMPLTVVEVLRALEAERFVAPDASGRWRPTTAVPMDAVGRAVQTGERRAVAARIHALDREARRLLSMLAIARRETAARTLAAATQLDQHTTLDRLDELARAGLARAGERGWSPSHDSVADVAAAEPDPADIARLHGMLATALTLEDAEPSEIADHLAAAGDHAAAASRYGEATDAAIRRFANREAEAFATAGLEAALSNADRSRLHTARAEARSRTGDLPGAREDLRAALASSALSTDRSALLTRMAVLEGGSEGYEHAEGLVELALSAAGDDALRRAEVLAVGSIVDLNLGRLDRAREHADEALALFESEGDARGVAGVLDGRAMTTFGAGRIREAEGLFDRVARLFLDAGELMRVGTPRSTRGHALVFLARPAEGLHDADEALELARDLAHAEGETYALWHRAEALAALSRSDDAVASATQAIAIAERIGHREWSASSLRALGIARQSGGDLDGAIDAFARSRAVGAEIPLFSAWAAAREGMCLVAVGRTDEAAPLIQSALAGGTPLSAYEARWGLAELLAATAHPDAAKAAVEAAAFAEEGGYLAALPRLRELAQSFA
jgi:DNA-binding SARP family transcriptional activator